MSEKLKQALRELTKNPRLDYLAMYPARVLKDKGGLVDIQPDDTRLPIMTDIPVRTCLPGMRLRVHKGSRVLLGFEDGDPSKPIVHLWEAGSLVAVEVETKEGYRASIDEEAKRVTLSTPGGRTVQLDDNAGVTRVIDPSAVELTAQTVQINAQKIVVGGAGSEVLLAGGTSPVARQGDAVAGGVISAGSLTVKSG